LVISPAVSGRPCRSGG